MKTVVYEGAPFTILVYGEVVETTKTKGLLVQPVFLTRDNAKIIKEAGRGQLLATQHPYSRTKSFNYGWAIHTQDDTFDFQVGVQKCRQRFAESPITTSTGHFLTKDVIQSILNNEVDYIEKHFDKFFRKNYRRRAQKNAVLKHLKQVEVKNTRFQINFDKAMFKLKGTSAEERQDFEETAKNTEKNFEETPKGTVRDGEILCRNDNENGLRRYICVNGNGNDKSYSVYWSATEKVGDEALLICNHTGGTLGLEPKEGYVKADPTSTVHILTLLRKGGNQWSLRDRKWI